MRDLNAASWDGLELLNLRRNDLYKVKSAYSFCSSIFFICFK